jgi:hypothetical protein
VLDTIASGGYSDIAKSVPEIIREASRSPAGLFALMLLILGGLAYYFFRSAGVKTRISIFVLLFCGVAMYGYAIHSVTEAIPEDASSKESSMIAGTIVDSDTNASVSQALVSALETNDRSTTDSTGAFRFTLNAIRSGTVIHLRVTKTGYKVMTLLIKAPNGSLVIPLDEDDKAQPKQSLTKSALASVDLPAKTMDSPELKKFVYEYQNVGRVCVGIFQQVSSSSWIEETQDTGGCVSTHYSFQQVREDKQSIILWDQSRGYAIRLPYEGPGMAEVSTSISGPWSGIHQLVPSK